MVQVQGEGWEQQRDVSFTYDMQQDKAQDADALGKKKKPDARRFNWYIQNVTLPVDNLGNKDERAAEGVIYVRDTTLEGFRNRMMGDGATNWSAVFNHPATFLLLDMRNPQRDVRLLSLLTRRQASSFPVCVRQAKMIMILSTAGQVIPVIIMRRRR